MNRDLFIKLIKELKNKNLINLIGQVIPKHELDKIVLLTKEEVNDILSIRGKDSKLIASKFYLYLKKDELSSDIKKIIEENIKKENVNVYYALSVINITGNIDMFNLVIATKEDYQAKYSMAIATNKDVLKRKDAISFVEIASYAKTHEQAQSICSVATNTKVLERKDKALSLVKMVMLVEDCSKLKYITKLATNSLILKKENTFEYVEVLLKTNDSMVSNVGEVALDERILAREESLEFMKTVASIEDPLIGEYVSKLSKSKVLLKRKNAIEFIKLVATSKEIYQAKYAYDILTNYKGISNKNILENIRLLVNTDIEIEAFRIRNNILKSLDYGENTMHNSTAIEEKNVGELIIDGDFTRLIEGVSNTSRYDDITKTTKVKVKRKN